MKSSLLVSLILLVVTSTAMGWGGRGHHVICSAAVHLVTEPGLKSFLQGRGHTLGHLCNVPDIYWKSLPKEISRVGDPTHFIDPEVIGLPIEKISLNFQALEKEHTGQENHFMIGRKIISVPEEFGSLWWRVDQFMTLISSRAEAFKISPPPIDRKQEQDEQLPYNREVYSMMVHMGILGHFVGDAGQPLHNTADYDGYNSGHGGLHSYYEEQTVSEAPANLEGRIYERAKNLQLSWMKKGTVTARMREFSAMIAKDLSPIFKKDPVIKKSILEREKGMVLRTPAERKPAKVGWKNFETLTIKQMASSAKLLAIFWDEAYVALGRPDLSAYRSFRYPFTPDFIPPDYLQEPSKKQSP